MNIYFGHFSCISEKTQPARQKKLQTSKYDDHETSIVVIDKPDERRLAFLERAIAEAGRGEIQKRLGIGKKVKATIGPM